jgi:hypothetical protein
MPEGLTDVTYASGQGYTVYIHDKQQACIREVPGSNINRSTNYQYSGIFVVFFSLFSRMQGKK